MTLRGLFTDIADAIRGKDGTSAPISAEDFPERIAAIPSGGGGATEPYVEETYNASGELTGAVMHGGTAVRDYYYRDSSKLESVTMPNGLKRIGEYAFYDCTVLNMTALPPSLTTIGARAFYRCKALTLTSLPSGIVEIPERAFYQCTKLALTSLPDGLTSIGDYAFQSTAIALTELPSGLQSINQYAMNGCNNLAISHIPASVKKVGMNAFTGTPSFTELTFDGTPTSMATTCLPTKLQVLNVPWAEGAISGAPWGATNATINYNYVPKEG